MTPLDAHRVLRTGRSVQQREIVHVVSCGKVADDAALLMSDPLRCLVVEDSPMMRQLLVFALCRIKGLVVVEATDGVDALRKLAAARFDVIVTDVNMPVMDGLKLVRRIRTDAIHKDVPIVIITTEGAETDRKRALELGANAYVVKPIQAPMVIATVKELLKIPSGTP
jgi:two-component system chemotaxis response regulator CheY